MYGMNPISPNEERSKTAILLLRIYIIFLFCSVFTEIVAAFALHKSGGDMRDALLVVGTVSGIAIIGGIVNLIFMIYFIMWLRRAYRNLHKAGSTALRHSEGWAAGAWFIPIMSFVWPLQIVRDTWNETQNVFRKRDEFFQREEDTITGWWWAFFLVAIFVGYIGSFSINFKNFEVGYAFTSVSHIGYLFSGFMLISVIRKITQMENEMMQRANGYYAWITQQQAEQYQQQQTANPSTFQQPVNPIHPESVYHTKNTDQPNSNEDQTSQDNFYKP